MNPEDGEVGYCSVMGARGEFCALSMYRGHEGLLSFEQMKRDADVNANSRIDTDTYLDRKSLMASFEGREDVDKRDRAVFQSLGLRFRGKQAWPVMRSYEPGCVAWFLDAGECRFLTYALGQAVVVAKRIRDNPNLLEVKEGFVLARKALNHDAPISGKWVDEWIRLPNLEDELANKDVMVPDIHVDEIRLKRIIRGGELKGTWEVDISYAPFSVAEGDRPYFPRLMLCVHHESGMILFALAVSHDAVVDEFVEQLVNAMEQNKVYPEQFVVKKKTVAALLEPVAHVVGADMFISDSLPGIEMAKEEMEDFML